MSYQERSITPEQLEKLITILDSDEGIRIDDGTDHIFVNRTGKRYCIEISKAGKEEFVYKTKVLEVMNFLKEMMTQKSKIFAY